MPRKKLTAAMVNRVTPPASGRAEYFDSVMTGLSLRVTDKGRKSWTVMYRHGGRLRRMTIGAYPAFDLKAAREAAGAALQEVAKGNDPALERAEKKAARQDLFADVAADFVEKYAKRQQRSWKETERIFAKYVTPKWRKRPIASITHRDMLDLLDGMDATPIMANRTLAAVRKLFNWAVGRRIIGATPVAGIEPPGKEKERDRVLDDNEIKTLWAGCDELGEPFGPLIRTLLLTAQRRDEVAGMRWQDIDLVAEEPIWTLPREFTKADRAHEVPLSPAVVEILKGQPRIRVKDENGNTKDGSYVFMTGRRGDVPISGFSVAKRRIDEITGLEGWTYHDLRRTAASGMARLNVPPHVLSRVLNHSPKSRESVTALYNRHAYTPEKRHALDSWARHLETLTAPVDDNVVPLKA